MADDGYLIGYEDGSGNFVEVGRFNNAAEDTNQPILIEHTASGERMELDGSGFDYQNADVSNVGVFSSDSVSTGDIETGRSWQDVQGSRSVNTEYTNNTNSEIIAVVNVTADADTTRAVLEGQINGVDQAAGKFDTVIDQGEHLSVYFAPVPVGGTYQTVLGGDVADINLDSWVEYRP